MLGVTTKEEVLEKAKEYNVKFIRLQFTGICGAFKNIAVTVEEAGEGLWTAGLFLTVLLLKGLCRAGKRIFSSFRIPPPSRFSHGGPGMAQ